MKRKASHRHSRGRFGIGRGLDSVGWIGWGLTVLITAVVALAIGSEGWESFARWRLARRVRSEFVQASCTVLESRMGTEVITKSVLHYRGQHQHRSTKQVTLYRPEVRYRYAVNGGQYVSTSFAPNLPPYETADPVQALLARYRVGEACTCWYDPKEPARSFLEP